MARKTPATLRTRWLGRMLRELRDDNNLTVSEVAEMLGRSQPMLSRMERGELPFQARDVDALLDLYRVEPDAREAIRRLHRSAGQAAWWDVYAEDVAEPVMDFAWFESFATKICVYSATVLDGLLQTSAYATVVTEATDIDQSSDVSRLVEMRLMRQAILNRSDPPEMSVVLDENVLRRTIGGPAVMAAQLGHLLTLSQRPHIDIRVLPFTAGAHASLDGQFRWLELPEPLTEMVSAIGAAGVQYLEPPRSQIYVARYARLRDAALSTDESAAMIAQLAEGLETA